MALLTYKNENNQIAMINESGTYKNPSGTAFWPGKVSSHEPDENLNGMEERYVGTDSRSFSDYTLGTRSHTGVINVDGPQDWRILKYAMGLVTDSGSPSPYQHDVKEDYVGSLAPETGEFFPSFTFEDYHGYGVAGSEFVRTYAGTMIDELEVSASPGEKIQFAASYIAGSMTYSSGAKTAVTASTNKSWKHSHFKWFMPSGTQIQTPLDWNVKITNGLEANDYSDQSDEVGTPIPTDRNNEIIITHKAERALQKTIYDTYFQGGSEFNMLLHGVISAGSNEVWWSFSGCRLVDADIPTEAVGISEQTLTIHPNKTSVKVYDDIFKWNAW